MGAAKLKGTLLESDDDDFEKEEGEKEEGEKDEEENNEEEKEKDVDEKKTNRYKLALSYKGPTFAFTFLDTSANASTRTLPESNKILIKIKGGKDVFGLRTSEHKDGQE